MLIRPFLLTALLTLLSCNAWSEKVRVTRDDIQFSLSIRTPDQQAAFYAARGFPEAAIRAITATCFLTVGIHNRSQQILWLELANWRLIDAKGQAVRRISRDVWEANWERLDVPLASRATFGWTQLPESRDLQPGEPVGGNVAIVAPPGSFQVLARFRTGQDGKGEPIEFLVKNLSCPEAAP